MSLRAKIVVTIFTILILLLISAVVLTSVGCGVTLGPRMVGPREINSVISSNRDHTRADQCESYNDYWTSEFGCLRRFNQYYGIFRGEYFYAILDKDGDVLRNPLAIHLYRSIYDNINHR